jgi:hypothetical protein
MSQDTLIVAEQIIASNITQGGTFNVKNYGATGNGTTSDKLAIATAMLAAIAVGGGIIFFPPGTYIIDSPITALGSNLTFQGAGESSIWKCASTNTGTNGMMIASSSTYSNITFKDMAFDGNGANLPDGSSRSDRKMIRIRNVTNFRMLNCSLHDARHGAIAEISNCTDLLIQGNRFYNIGVSAAFPCDALYASGNSRYRVMGNIVNGTTGLNTDTAFAQDGVDHSSIIGNTIDGMTDGVSVSTSSALTSQDNIIANNTIKGVGLTANSYGVQVRQLGGVGAGVNLQDIIIANNVFENVNSAVWIEKADRVKVTGNISTSISGTEMYHVKLNTAAGTCNDLTIRNNTFSAGTRGIHFSSTGTYGGNMVVEENDFIGTTTPIFSLTSSAANNYVRDNPGWNPIGFFSGTGSKPSNPAVPSSTVAQTNTFGYDATVFVTGGTVSQVTIGGRNTGVTLSAGQIAQFRVPSQQTITLTYSVAPTWEWHGD